MEERELPVGWVGAQVGEVCRLLNGRAYSKSELLETGKYRVLRVGNLFTNPHWYYSNLELEEDKYCQAGDLLYAWSASFGPYAWEGARVIYHYHIWKVQHDKDLIHRDFLKAFLQWDTNRIKQQQGSGSTMLHVTKKSMEERAIPVPPSPEQRRIAAKLDSTLAAADACRQRLDGVAAILTRFRQAVLAGATSGELTREWREGRPGLIETWRTVKTKEAGKIQLGRQRSPKYHNGPTMRPYLRVQNIFEDRIDLDDVMEMDFSGADLEKYTLHPGDILLNEGQSPQYLGRPAMYRGELPGACFTNSLIRFQAGASVMPDFALFVFRHCMHSGRYIQEGTITTNIAHLSAGRFGEVDFPLPSPEEQQEIVRRAQDLFTLADQLEARLTAARKSVDRLTPALLAKAFRGELVPQDPRDEPASVLLERIRAARQAEAGAGKPSRRGRPKAAASPATVAREAAPVPADCLAALLRECGALSERALLAASELEPARFRAQLALERQRGAIRDTPEDGGQVLLEASA